MSITPLLCRLGFHNCVLKYDHTGCWGECARCGSRFGFVAQSVLCNYVDREWEQWKLAMGAAKKLTHAELNALPVYAKLPSHWPALISMTLPDG
jgi:hypothetical protein